VTSFEAIEEHVSHAGCMLIPVGASYTMLCGIYFSEYNETQAAYE